MTQLKTLRRQLSALRRRRRGVRWLTAYSALASAIIWAAIGIFAVDLFFFKTFQVALDAPQRVIVIVIAGAATFAAFYLLTRPLTGVRETTEEMALLVERNQQIDSDLIAALQFESPAAADWGSRQLEVAVIDYVGRACRGLNVFEGFAIDQMVRRGLILLISSLVIIGVHVALPDHMQVFWRRLALSGEHYPTNTVLQRIVVNHNTVMVRQGYHVLPENSKSPQGQPLTFTVLCQGDLPAKGTARFVSTGEGPRRDFEIDLLKIDDKQRLARLQEGETRVQKAIADPGIDVKGPWQQEMASLVGFDAPDVVATLNRATLDRSVLVDAHRQLATAVKTWSTVNDSSLFIGRLDRFVDPLSYTIHVGDAWTGRAHVEVIPLPIVEPNFNVAAPDYARGAVPQRPDPSTRIIPVLEGSQVRVAVVCTNQKRLVDAWMTLTSGDVSTRLQLVNTDSSGQRWALDATGTPLQTVEKDLRFEIQVEDSDGLHLESPIRGSIRIRTDRPPTGSIHWVHRLALPTAQLTLHYNVTDDFGVDRLVLQTQVERAAQDPPPANSVTETGAPTEDRRVSLPLNVTQLPEHLRAGASIQYDGRVVKVEHVTQVVTGTSAEDLSDNGQHGYEILGVAENGDRLKILLPPTELITLQSPVLKQALPLEGRCKLDLAKLKLVKGDRLKIELEMVDYRGKRPGKSTRSDSLVLNITDESGVLAAVSEADERSEKQLTDIIKRQLGIGESP